VIWSIRPSEANEGDADDMRRGKSCDEWTKATV